MSACAKRGWRARARRSGASRRRGSPADVDRRAPGPWSELRGDGGMPAGTAAGDEYPRRVGRRELRRRVGVREDRAQHAAEGKRARHGARASADTGWLRTAPARGDTSSSTVVRRSTVSDLFLGPRPAAATGARRLRPPSRGFLFRSTTVHAERGELQRRSRGGLKPGNQRRFRFGLGPDVFVEEALLRQRAAHSRDGAASSRRNASFALECFVGDERVLEQHEEEPSARVSCGPG